MFIDSITVLFLVANLLTMLRKIKTFNTVLNSLEHSISIIIRGTFIWFNYNLGLCYFNMSIYGGQYKRYNGFLNAYIGTLYG